ncbi:uncharacterized protein LOC131480389 [Ochotona princeps]|uniref:uncharacterized protein LOC131480389 n=1 Tax=Ochotona princeps TaxID=9978 RepID=UPI002714C618|nr:uncharacterized protein LOC131480389 [Ochotona princeps]
MGLERRAARPAARPVLGSSKRPETTGRHPQQVFSPVRGTWFSQDERKGAMLSGTRSTVGRLGPSLWNSQSFPEVGENLAKLGRLEFRVKILGGVVWTFQVHFSFWGVCVCVVAGSGGGAGGTAGAGVERTLESFGAEGRCGTWSGGPAQVPGRIPGLGTRGDAEGAGSGAGSGGMQSRRRRFRLRPTRWRCRGEVASVAAGTRAVTALQLDARPCRPAEA